MFENLIIRFILHSANLVIDFLDAFGESLNCPIFAYPGSAIGRDDTSVDYTKITLPIMASPSTNLLLHLLEHYRDRPMHVNGKIVYNCPAVIFLLRLLF